MNAHSANAAENEILILKIAEVDEVLQDGSDRKIELTRKIEIDLDRREFAGG